MKLQFKHQKFQADAAKAVVDVFAGQPYLTPSYMMDRGAGRYQQSITDEDDFTGWANAKIVPELNDRLILENIQNVQKILILDFGGQYKQLIARRVRECNVYCEIHPHTLKIEKMCL